MLLLTLSPLTESLKNTDVALSEKENEIDTSDGLVLNDSQSLLYNFINNEKYVIQGRELPFQDTDIVPLGLKINQAGNYSISFENAD